jgi:hypothetical protein
MCVEGITVRGRRSHLEKGNGNTEGGGLFIPIYSGRNKTISGGSHRLYNTIQYTISTTHPYDDPRAYSTKDNQLIHPLYRENKTPIIGFICGTILRSWHNTIHNTLCTSTLGANLT